MIWLSLDYYLPRSIKCGHALLGPRIYCISACPFAAARHDPGPGRRRLHVGSMGVVVAWAVGRRRFGLGGGRSRRSLLPSRSLRVVRVACAFLTGQSRPGWARRGQPATPWRVALTVADRRIRVASESSGDTGRRRAGVSLPHCAAGRSEHHRRAGEWDQNK